MPPLGKDEPWSPLWNTFKDFFELGFTPCKAKEPLLGIESQEKDLFRS